MLGLSNGANFAAAFTALYPGTFRRAILIRSMMVLDAPEPVDLSDMHVLTLTGSRDPFAPQGAALNEWLRRCGAELEAHEVAADHGLVPDDLAMARAWVASDRDP